ncbi:DUF2069 domain-containing protein [Acidovorax sp. DW039]|nr:DUF2069 domain-containing protein [Acidovorax sp. DW039]
MPRPGLAQIPPPVHAVAAARIVTAAPSARYQPATLHDALLPTFAMTENTAALPSNPIAPEVAATRWLAVGSLVALIALCLAWELVLAPVRPGGSWLAIKALPLCIPLPGILKNRMYTYRWVSLVIWLYFTEGVVRAWSDKSPGNWLAMAEIALCLVLFTACTLHVRLRQRNAKLQAAAVAAQHATTQADPLGNTPFATPFTPASPINAQADIASAPPASTEPVARKD